MNGRTESFQIYGQAEAPLKLIPLRAGPLTMLYDPANAMLRRIKLGEREVLRGIYAAVRDQNWGTVPGVIREGVREITEQSFRIEFESMHQQEDIFLTWRGVISGGIDGHIRYEFQGEAKSNFLRNRIGFCVLHPIAECTRARQTRINGRTMDCQFPELIEPQIFGKSSFQQLRAVAHEVSQNVWAEVSFEGDTFEMEDQRNWIDASFKTYCTPLSLPFPVQIKKGDRIRQAVDLCLIGEVTNDRSKTFPLDMGVTLTIPSTPFGSLPAFGLGTASHGDPLTISEVTELRRLKLSHLRVEVRFSQPDVAARLEQSIRDAEQLNVRLEIALYLPGDGKTEGSEILRILERTRPRIVRILALREGEPATSLQTLAWVKNHFQSLGVPIGSGSDFNFCELNREHALGSLALNDSRFLFWSINPQVHASDPLSVMETLEALPAIVRSAASFSEGRPLIISPITLKQRFNPVATNGEVAVGKDELPPQVDPRQLSRFAALWTLGSIIALASAGVESLTYFETTGWRGVMERDAGSLLPTKFPSVAGELFPVFDVFAKLAGFKQFAVAHTTDSKSVTALSLFRDGRLERTLIANLTDSVQRPKILGAKDEERLMLEPYSVTSLEHPEEQRL